MDKSNEIRKRAIELAWADTVNGHPVSEISEADIQHHIAEIIKA